MNGYTRLQRHCDKNRRATHINHEMPAGLLLLLASDSWSARQTFSNSELNGGIEKKCLFFNGKLAISRKR